MLTLRNLLKTVPKCRHADFKPFFPLDARDAPDDTTGVNFIDEYNYTLLMLYLFHSTKPSTNLCHTIVSLQSISINLPGYNNQTALLFALGNPNTPVDLVQMLISNGASVDVLDAERDGCINYLYDTRTRRNNSEFLQKLRLIVDHTDFQKMPFETTWPREEDVL